MGASDSREITYNWEVPKIGRTWIISKPFGFPDNKIGTFYVNVVERPSVMNPSCQDCCIKINKVGGIKINAHIEVKLNKKSPRRMDIINWTGLSDEFLFYGDMFIPLYYDITCTIKLDGNNNDNVSQYLAQELANVNDFFLSPEFSDITIKVDDQEFPAHKIVLACHSPVFKRMLSADMKEKRENCIDLSEFDAKSIKEVLRFLYGGEVQADNVDLLLKLSSFSHMYEISRLKDYCESKLVSSFQVNNVIEILLAIDNYDMDKVKNEAMEFLMKNKATISYNDAIDNIQNSQVLRKFFSNVFQMKN